uniref:Uncharacterized protein n=1 Tax=Acrobeloides nanus TaxID=290746 RepID=A0A914DDA2_9BILA
MVNKRSTYMHWSGKWADYNLSQNYQIFENTSTIRGMIPFVSIHSLSFAIYCAYALILRVLVYDLKTLQNFILRKILFQGTYSFVSLYILIIMCIMYFIPLGKRKSPTIVIKTQEATEYFKLFDAQINTFK